MIRRDIQSGYAPPYTDDDGNEQNEDVELAITYKISWDTLVSKGTDVKNLEQFDDGKLKDIDTGFIVNYAYTDGSGAFHNLNRTKTMRKEGLSQTRQTASSPTRFTSTRE